MVSTEKLLEEIALLKLMVHQLSKENAMLKAQVDEKKEIENVLRMRSFGKKSEVHTDQLSLFNMPSDASFPNAETTESQTLAKPTSRPRKKLYENVKPYYQNVKQSNNITHWRMKNGSVFVVSTK